MKPDIVTRRFLRATYGAHSETILRDYLELLPRKKGAMQTFQLKLTLPAKDEFWSLRAKHFTVTVTDAIGGSCSELESLKDELQEWYDNLPENFQNGEKGEQLQEAINNLDNISEPSVSDKLGAITFVYIPAEKIESRADRCGDAINCLGATAEALRDWLEEEKAKFVIAGGDAEKFSDEDGAEDLAEELDNLQSNADQVEFPGMY